MDKEDAVKTEQLQEMKILGINGSRGLRDWGRGGNELERRVEP